MSLGDFLTDSGWCRLPLSRVALTFGPASYRIADDLLIILSQVSVEVLGLMR